MNLHEIQEKILDAIRLFIERDKNALLTSGVHEQAMSHRIAVYLEQPFTGYHVECEWDTHLGNDKIVQINGQNLSVRPDIIIHKVRHTDEENLVAIEVKKVGYSTSLGQKDVEKIKSILSSFHYGLGVYVGVLKNCVEVLWIRKGANGELVEAFELL